MTEAITEVSTAWQQAWAIMEALGETERMPRVQITRAIEALGLDVVETVVAEARTAETNGGLLRKDGSRRTLGGVFFHLLRERCTSKQRAFIFYGPQRKAAAAQASPTPPPPSEQAQQIAGVIIERLKISQKKQTAVARDVDRVGVPAAMQVLRATLKVEQQGGRKDADGKRMKPLKVWQAALEAAPEKLATQVA